MRFVFGTYVLDPGRCELTENGQAVAVEPQVFDLLHHLIRERGRVVTKDDLIETIWRGRIVSESTLTSRVNAARKAIGDNGRDQKLIRTYARRGVRFVGEVHEETPLACDSATASTALPQVSAAAAPGPDVPAGKPLVLVLPFRNLSTSLEQEHLAEAVTQDVVTALSWHRSILVTAGITASCAAAPNDTIRSTGRGVGADYLVTGTVRVMGERVRITAQLIETDAGGHLWAERYDLEVSELSARLDDITAKIAARIEQEVSAAERLRLDREPERDLCARDYFQLGQKHFYRATRADNIEAQQLFRRAIALDPSIAQAHAFLSYAIVLGMVYFDAVPGDALLMDAIDIARRGVELDGRDAMVRFAYGRALLARRDYANALAAMNTALELNPTMAVVYCGLADSLAYESRFDEAFPYFEKAIGLSPHDPQRWAFMSYRSLAHLFAGEFEQAAEWAQKATQVPGAHYWPYAHRVAALGQLQRSGEAAIALAELQQLKPEFSCTLARERLFFVKNPAHLDAYVEGLQKAGVRE